MEKSDNIYVIKSEFDWNDLGSWDAVFDVSPKTKDQNVIRGDGLVIDGKNNLIESNNHFTAVLGLNNIVVVNTSDATLVIPRDKVEDIKSLVSYLEKNKKSDLL
jgi:mannose-1-phosphate guanylyltransferase